MQNSPCEETSGCDLPAALALVFEFPDGMIGAAAFCIGHANRLAEAATDKGMRFKASPIWGHGGANYLTIGGGIPYYPEGYPQFVYSHVRREA